MRVPEFQPIIVLSTTILSFVVNGILLFLIIYHTREQMRVYSRFMLSFALFNTIYPLVCFFVAPILFASGNGFMMFTTGIVTSVPFLAFFGLLMYVSAYAQSLALLCFHFIYRYSLVCKMRFLREMDPWEVWCWLIGLYLAMACGYCLNAYVFLVEDPVVQAHFEKPFREKFEDNIYSLMTLGGVYFATDAKTGEHRFYWKSWVGTVICMVVISSSFVLITFCGRAIYRAILESSSSEKTKKAQMGIFRALIIQTLIPVVFEYVPSGIILLFPIFGISLDTTFVTISFGIYSFVEPLAMIYFVADYRNAVSYYFCRAAGRPHDRSLKTTVKVITTF